MAISRDRNMTYNPAIHQRRSIRLKGYDYAQAGAYFITICTHQRKHIFGEIIGAGVNPALITDTPAPFTDTPAQIKQNAQPRDGQPYDGQPRGLPLQDDETPNIGFSNRVTV